MILLMALGLSACSKETESTINTFGLPQYDKGTYQLAGENQFNLLGTTKEDFVSYVNLVKQEGYTYSEDGLNCSEEMAIEMDFWQGKKDGSIVTIHLMIDLNTSTNYIRVNKSAE